MQIYKKTAVYLSAAVYYVIIVDITAVIRQRQSPSERFREGARLCKGA